MSVTTVAPPVNPESEPRTRETHTYHLPQYPDYEFDDQGTPYMIRQPRRGKRMKLGRVEPTITSKFQETYLLRREGGGRDIKSQRQLKEMINQTGTSVNYLYLERFPAYRFDAEGTAYSRARNRPCKYRPDVDKYGFPIKRYILRDYRDMNLNITNRQLCRILCGKAGDMETVIPDHMEPLTGNFIDYAYSAEEDALYRIGRKRGFLPEPKKIRGTKTRFYRVTDSCGKAYTLPLRKILEYGNYSGFKYPEDDGA